MEPPSICHLKPKSPIYRPCWPTVGTAARCRGGRLTFWSIAQPRPSVGDIATPCLADIAMVLRSSAIRRDFSRRPGFEVHFNSTVRESSGAGVNRRAGSPSSATDADPVPIEQQSRPSNDRSVLELAPSVFRRIDPMPDSGLVVPCDRDFQSWGDVRRVSNSPADLPFCQHDLRHLRYPSIPQGRDWTR